MLFATFVGITTVGPLLALMYFTFIATMTLFVVISPLLVIFIPLLLGLGAACLTLGWVSRAVKSSQLQHRLEFATGKLKDTGSLWASLLRPHWRGVDKGTEVVNNEPDGVVNEKEAVGKETDAVQQQTETVVNETEGVDKGTEVVNNEPDGVVNEKEAVGKETDAVQQQTETVVNETEGVDKGTEVVNNEPDGVVNEMEAVGKETDAVQQQTETVVNETEKEVDVNLNAFEYDFDNVEFDRDFPMPDVANVDHSEDSDDSDYIVDKDNEVDEVEVDMRDFGDNVSEGEEYVAGFSDGSLNSGTEESSDDFESTRIESNPKLSTKSVQDELLRRYELNCSKMKAFRAKTKAANQLRGDYKEQYTRLRDYILELQANNTNTTVKFVVEDETNPDAPTRIFKRVYVCLGPLKDGFKACKRELLGLDGAFMKGPYPGQLLTAVGIDPNNGIYPLAYAIVEAENKLSWTWFLQCVADDLEKDERCNFTFISDRQKGLIPALAKVFPSAEHRFCLRHLHQNMKLRWRGKAFKDLLWGCATTTTVQEFRSKMEELRTFNTEAHKWLSSIPPQHWTRSHFTGRAKTDVLLNNMCEVLNGKLVEARDQPIISALEFIREYLAKRIVNVIKVIEKSDGPLTPTATKLMEGIKTEAAKYTVMWHGGSKYQVSGPWGEQVVVDVNDRNCTCRRWDLTGLPCKHAVAVNWNMALNGQQVVPPECWAHSSYKLSTWKKVYSYKIAPLNGKNMWPKSDSPTTLTPPLHNNPIGRPKKKRRKNQAEIQDDLEQANKLTRSYKSFLKDSSVITNHNLISLIAPGRVESCSL
ncbi:hypothetical protein L1987_73954 [Smallanthus sonchifolius]|uniref:Uncharacterized protein n=1 Tax=Smallanthus sonchifolius TaxID=185202 RepID=A0ACB9A1C9_9ASTR|nr:hypothetical protein L1987_73954 [Smallanthus sonchifolius]